jgi:glycerate-2-kinase
LTRSIAREDALALVEAAYASIDTAEAIKAEVTLEGDMLQVMQRKIPLKGKLFVVAIGKCALAASRALEDMLGARIHDGIALDVAKAEPGALHSIRPFQGTHPLPSPENIQGAKAIRDLLTGLTPEDTVLFVISGGGSTLLCLPESEDASEEANMFSTLMEHGATIGEINTVRKHLSYARGGWLAKATYPAQVISLIFSDVVGNDLSVIASGPTVQDESTIHDAEAVLARYGITEPVALIETPKEAKYFKQVENMLLVSNTRALQAMEREGEARGYRVRIVTDTLQGETRDAAERVFQDIQKEPPRTILLYGGETTVSEYGGGQGGRNLEFALTNLERVGGHTLILSFASDGEDHGPFAGAICDMMTLSRAKEKGVGVTAALKSHASQPFFEAVGDYLLTGKTGSNVADLVIALQYA